MALAMTSKGARIAWDSFGDETQPPLILIQGFTAQMVGWRPGFCQQLADRGFHVIRFDNRDVGQSQRYPQGGYTLVDLADDTAELIAALGLESAHIVGQSMGGMVAQHLALKHPARVRSLGLIYTAANDQHFLGRDSIAERMGRPVPTTREEYVPFYVANEEGCASPGYPQDIAWLTELAGVIWDRGWDAEGTPRQLQAVMSMPTLNDVLHTIRVPTLLVVGDGDQLIDPRASIELHQLMPGSTLEIMPGMGHELPQALWDRITEQLASNAHAADSKRK